VLSGKPCVYHREHLNFFIYASILLFNNEITTSTLFAVVLGRTQVMSGQTKIEYRRPREMRHHQNLPRWLKSAEASKKDGKN